MSRARRDPSPSASACASRFDRHAILLSHQQRDNRQPREQPAQKRQLHLEGMLAGMNRRQHADDVRRADGCRRRRVDRYRTEGARERAVGVQRNALERHEMRRADEHRDVVRVPGCGLVRTGADRTREHDASVRRDNRADFTLRPDTGPRRRTHRPRAPGLQPSPDTTCPRLPQDEWSWPSVHLNLVNLVNLLNL